MTITIVPTVLANSKEEFDARLRKLLPVADEIQVDIMDGRFVPSVSLSLDKIPDVSGYRQRFEAHLMVERPGAYIQPLARRGFKRIIFHIEAADDKVIPMLLLQCKRHKVEPVLAINPETPVKLLLPWTAHVKGIVFLGVHPGFNGAPYLPQTADRIKKFLKQGKSSDLIIQVDGGMTPQTIGAVVAAGATRINSGSFVSNAADPKKAIMQLRAGTQRTAAGSAPKKNAKARNGKARGGK
jgi:ribulose-phosphate 3-epimerase